MASANQMASAKLLYIAIASLDGYVADESGTWDWSAPDEEVHAFVNDVTRAAGTHLYGRRIYDVLVAWERPDELGEVTPAMRDFAELWQGADKVVYSRTLDAVSSARTRIEREFDPEAVRRLKATAGRDITVSGPQLAAQAIAAGLVDEIHLLLSPVIVGGGKRALPEGLQARLELIDVRRVERGVVSLHYAAATNGGRM